MENDKCRHSTMLRNPFTGMAKKHTVANQTLFKLKRICPGYPFETFRVRITDNSAHAQINSLKNTDLLNNTVEKGSNHGN